MSPADVSYVIPTIHPISIIAYPAERMELIPGTSCRRWVTPRISLKGYTERLTIPIENWGLPIRLTCLFLGESAQRKHVCFSFKIWKMLFIKIGTQASCCEVTDKPLHQLGRHHNLPTSGEEWSTSGRITPWQEGVNVVRITLSTKYMYFCHLCLSQFFLFFLRGSVRRLETLHTAAEKWHPFWRQTPWYFVFPRQRDCSSTTCLWLWLWNACGASAEKNHSKYFRAGTKKPEWDVNNRLQKFDFEAFIL